MRFGGGYSYVNLIMKFFFLTVFITGAIRSTAFAQNHPENCLSPPPNTSGQSLNNKLGQSNGVICPPNVDPQMKVPTPNSGDKTVIPPPGSPGGDPNVQPK
jgi:hypothetical protein